MNPEEQHQANNKEIVRLSNILRVRLGAEMGTTKESKRKLARVDELQETLMADILFVDLELQKKKIETLNKALDILK